MEHLGSLSLGPKKTDFRSKVGQNQVWGEVLGGGRGQRGRSGWDGAVGPPKSLDSKCIFCCVRGEQGFCCSVASQKIGPDPSQGKKIHININKFAGLSRDWVGAKILFMCFLGSFLMGEKKHINKVPPPPNPGTIPWEFCLRVSFFMCFFPQKYYNRLGAMDKRRLDSLI